VSQIQISPTIDELSVEKKTVLGRPLKRKEDPRLLRGQGSFVDDKKFRNMLHAAVVRSPYGHAKILDFDVKEAATHPGVHLIITGNDLDVQNKSMPSAVPTGNRKSVRRAVLPEKVVRYQGEAVAFLVADDRHNAEDCAELIHVDYSPLQCIIDPQKSKEKGALKIHQELESNVVNHYVKEFGDIAGCFAEADEIVELSLLNQRVAPAPLEPRTIIADFDSEILTVWIGTQSPFEIRKALSDVLGLPEERIKVISPDVGGAFGAKAYLYPEDILTCLSSMRLGRPVKWIESRSENLSTMIHGRGQFQKVRAAVKRDGTILGLDASITSDTGAFPTVEGVWNAEITVDMLPALYDLKSFRAELFCALTNKVPFDAYRGAGRPEATYLIERIIDRIAIKLELDPTEVRFKNFVKKDAFPFRNAAGLLYDSGDYESNLRKALECIDYDSWRSRQKIQRNRSGSKMIGIGVSSYLEWASWSPWLPQTATVTVAPSGSIRVVSGATPNGQGHETPFAQIVADEFGVDIDRITVTYGDTINIPYGTETGGSRSASIAGTAILMSARKIKEKMVAIAAKELGLRDSRSLVFEDGKIFSKDSQSKSIGFDEVAMIAYQPERLPALMEPSLFAYSAFAPKNFTFPYGTHIAVVEVDIDTGEISIIDYVAVDDCGRVLNSMVVEGQVHGGVMQGIGQALLENIQYDENGQLLTSNFLDYLLPSASDTVPIRCFRTETPSPENPLGVKGIGEAGTIAAPPAVVNAVEDALSQNGVVIDAMPLSLDYVYNLANSASKTRRTKRELVSKFLKPGSTFGEL
jgi:carbon-monoxide dehydrogenase large subunit